MTTKDFNKIKEPLKNYLIRINKGEIIDVGYKDFIYHPADDSKIRDFTILLDVDWDKVVDGLSSEQYIWYIIEKYRPQVNLFMDMTGNNDSRGFYSLSFDAEKMLRSKNLLD